MKIVVSDLDGTLLADSVTVSKENIEAIKKLAEKGTKIVICTGRTFYEIPQELINNQYIEYFIFSNGAGIYKNGTGIINYSPLEPDTAMEIFKIANFCESFIEVYSNGKALVDLKKFNDESFKYYRIDPEFLPEMKRSRVAVKSLYKKLHSINAEVEMYDIFFRHMREREDCINKIRHYFPEVEITTSMRNNIEIMNRGINKGSGIKKLCDVENFDLKDLLVIGDSKNDISMFNVVDKCFAVSNACDELKSISNRIICSNKENVMVYINKYLEAEGE